MEIKDIAVAADMEAVRGGWGGTSALAIQAIGPRSQSNSAYQTGGIHNGAGAGQALGQSNVDNSINKQSMGLDLSSVVTKSFTANDSVFGVSGFGFGGLK